MGSLKKTVTTLLKIAVSGLLIFFIYKKIDLKNIWDTLQSANFAFIALAILFFVFSKILAAVRLNYFFKSIAIPLTHKSNLKLYSLGMFYNLFLPGGIGGDAYKAYLLKKRFKIPTKKIILTLFADRLVGLLALYLYASVLLLALPQNWVVDFRWVILVLMPLSILILWLLTKYLFKEVLAIFNKALAYSAVIQFMQLCCVWCLMLALHIQIQTFAYLTLFLISSIVAILPLTLGGIGSREATFFYGATLLQLNEVDALSISVLFFIVTALVSLYGVFYHFKKVPLQIDDNLK